MTAMRSTLPSAHTTSKGWWQRSWQAATGRASEAGSRRLTSVLSPLFAALFGPIPVGA
jgi:hypothetical protein